MLGPIQKYHDSFSLSSIEKNVCFNITTSEGRHDAKAVGIIAEYNPFHNGRKYQIEQARRMTDADYVVVVIGGFFFVRRNACTWTDKYLRTQIALECGADMSIELPTAYATASAKDFASAGSAAAGLGFVDTLALDQNAVIFMRYGNAARFLADPGGSL